VQRFSNLFTQTHSEIQCISDARYAFFDASNIHQFVVYLSIFLSSAVVQSFFREFPVVDLPDEGL